MWSVLAEHSASKPLFPDASAILGSIVHHLRREIAEGRGKGSDSSSLKACLQEMALQAENEIAKVLEEAFDLRDAVGWWQWGRAERRLERWAKISSGPASGRPRPLSSVLAHPTGAGPESDMLEFGEEVWLVSRRLRIRGRADQIVKSNREIDIIDYKSGRTEDAEGQLIPDAIWQLRLYGLVAEELSPGSLIRLFLHGDERREIPWDDKLRAETVLVLQERLDLLPRSQRLEAEAFASPGPHCTFCRIRPQCAPYLRGAPSLWEDRARAGLLPLVRISHKYRLNPRKFTSWIKR